jgi:glutathione synthase/RimK-type ligase-like ATP-grasp enzyme
VTNKWQAIHDHLPSHIILKMWRGIFFEGNDVKCLYTTPLRNTPDALPINTLPFPGIWQPFLGNKRREWRITVVGKDFFDAAIYTSPDAKDDWRRHVLGKGAEFRNEPFPDELKDKCLALLEESGCRFGCFDFIEDDEGCITFLEMNPNGQYYWLEEDLGLPISKAIARELVSIAQTHT